jgi:hypothetical protein
MVLLEWGIESEPRSLGRAGGYASMTNKGRRKLVCPKEIAIKKKVSFGRQGKGEAGLGRETSKPALQERRVGEGKAFKPRIFLPLRAPANTLDACHVVLKDQ